jgi:peptide-methionine (S)-S-oxide reductase
LSVRRVLLPLTALLVPLLAGAAQAQTESATAIFAGGCFWCMEPPFDALPGVVSTTSGYIGGQLENPTYKQVSGGRTGHAEAVQIVYDPSQISYEALLETFWHNIDPTVKDRQFCDTGSQYRSVIFVSTPEERGLAEASRERVAAQLGVPVRTEIVEAGPFYPAEEYHQDYYRKNPIRYAWYRRGCGRDARLAELWGADAPAH